MSTTRAIASVVGLWALAVAQPMLDVLGRAPEFFVAHRADGLDTALVAVGLVLSGPIAMAAVLLAARYAGGERTMRVVGAALVGVPAGLVAATIGYRLGLVGSFPTLLLSVAGGAACAIVWHRRRAVRTFTLALSPAAIVVPLVFLAAGPLGASDASASAAVGGGRATPVVLVVFDELSLVALMEPDGHINRARYPNLAALAADGVWFRNATAVSDYTRFALPAILTGRYPTSGSIPTPRDHPNTVFSLLGRTHRVEAFEAVTAICPRSLCSGLETPRGDRLRAIASDLEIVAAHLFLPPAARGGLPSLTANWAGFADEDDGASAGADNLDETAADDTGDAGDDSPGPITVKAVRNWRTVWRQSAGADHLGTAQAFVDGIAPDNPQPTLYVMHTLVSHHPARWLPSGQRIGGRRAMPGQQDGAWPNEPWLVDQHHHAHLLQAALADALIGRLRERLEAAGLYDRTLVIVTADHGASFRPGAPMRAFTPRTAADIAFVPLVMKLPAGTPGPAPGTIDDRNAETIDVLPTIADVVGAAPGWAVDGASLIRADAARSGKRFFFNLATMEERLQPDDLAAQRDEAIRYQAARFGSEPWPTFTLEPLARLIGRQVETFGTIEEASDIRVRLDRNRLARVDLAAPELPVQVSGRLTVPDGMPFDRAALVIALNGRVVATTRAWSPAARWAAMLPPSALQAGRNRLDVFIVDPARPERLRRPEQ